MDRWSRQEIGKDIFGLTNTINQLDIMDIYRLLHPSTAGYTHGTFTKIDHILDHKMHLNKFNKTNHSDLLSEHNRIKLEINYRKIARKSQNTWRLNNTLLNNTWVKEDISSEITYFELNENENTTYQNLWVVAIAVLRRTFIALNTCIRKEERSKINHLSFHLRKPEEQIKSKVSRGKEIIKIRAGLPWWRGG